MIRYVHIGDQIEEGAEMFAFFDTICDRFITLHDSQVFADAVDVTAAWALADAAGDGPPDLGRLLSLVPSVAERMTESPGER